MNLPFVTAQFRRPDLRLPRGGRPDVGGPRARPPPRRGRCLRRSPYYAGLGLLAVVEVIEWPVALVVGAGTALARGGRNGGGGRGAGDTGRGGDRGSPGAGAEGSRPD